MSRSVEIILAGRNETASPFNDARAELKRWEAEVQRASKNVRAASRAGDEGSAASQQIRQAAAQERLETARQAAEYRKALQQRLAMFKAAKAEEARVAQMHADAMTALGIKSAGAVAVTTTQTSGLMQRLIRGNQSAESAINGVKYGLQGLVGTIPGLDMVATSIAGLGVAAGAVVAGFMALGNAIRRERERMAEFRAEMRATSDEAVRFSDLMTRKQPTTEAGSRYEAAIANEAALLRRLNDQKLALEAKTKDPLVVARSVIQAKFRPVETTELEVAKAQLQGVKDQIARARNSMDTLSAEAARERRTYAEQERQKQQADAATKEKAEREKAAKEAEEIERRKADRLAALRFQAESARIDAMQDGHLAALAQLRLQRDRELAEEGLTEQMREAIRSRYASQAIAIQRNAQRDLAAAGEAAERERQRGGGAAATIRREGVQTVESRFLTMAAHNQRHAEITADYTRRNERNTAAALKKFDQLRAAMDQVAAAVAALQGAGGGLSLQVARM